MHHYLWLNILNIKKKIYKNIFTHINESFNTPLQCSCSKSIMGKIKTRRQQRRIYDCRKNECRIIKLVSFFSIFHNITHLFIIKFLEWIKYSDQIAFGICWWVTDGRKNVDAVFFKHTDNVPYLFSTTRV